MKGLWEGRGLSRPGIARCTQRRLVLVKAVPAMINLATRDRGPPSFYRSYADGYK